MIYFTLISIIILNPILLKANTIMPSFDRASENVTVIIGNAVTLPCFISNLGDHKVAWIKVANMDILAIGDYKVTNDDRIKLLHGYVSDWSLSIQPVNEEDSGEYICQVNTEPQIITRIFLQVLLPPKIIEEKSTINPGPVKEGSTLKLYCHSEGSPVPKVLWYFRKRSGLHTSILINRNQTNIFVPHNKLNEQVIHEGDTLFIKNISRLHSGVYECIANNTVPPAASRKIRVSVEFAPEIQLQSEKVEQLIGLDARFECRIKANPLINHYWMKDGQVIENSVIADNSHDATDTSGRQKVHSKYEMNIYNQNNNEYLTVSALVIRNITKKDFGVYQCFAVNSLNTTKAEVNLKELIYRRTLTTKAPISKILVYNNNNNQDIPGGDVINRNSFKDYRLTSSQTKSGKSNKKNTNSSKLNKLSEDDDYDEFKNDNLYNGQISTRKMFNKMTILISIIFSFYFDFI